jgi:hypothetical protein
MKLFTAAFVGLPSSSAQQPLMTCPDQPDDDDRWLKGTKAAWHGAAMLHLHGDRVSKHTFFDVF